MISISVSVFFFMMVLYLWLAIVTYAAINEAITSYRGGLHIAGAVSAVLVWPVFWLALAFVALIAKVLFPASTFVFEKAFELGTKIGHRIS